MHKGIPEEFNLEGCGIWTNLNIANLSPCKFWGKPKTGSQKINNVILMFLISWWLWNSEAAANDIVYQKNWTWEESCEQKERERAIKLCFKDSGSLWYMSKAGNIQSWAVNSFDNLIDVCINWIHDIKYMILQVLIFPHENDYHEHFALWHVCELVPLISQTQHKRCQYKEELLSLSFILNVFANDKAFKRISL